MSKQIRQGIARGSHRWVREHFSPSIQVFSSAGRKKFRTMDNESDTSPQKEEEEGRLPFCRLRATGEAKKKEKL